MKTGPQPRAQVISCNLSVCDLVWLLVIISKLLTALPTLLGTSFHSFSERCGRFFGGIPLAFRWNGGGGGGERGQSSPIEEKGGTVEHWLPMRWGRGGGGGNGNITKSYVGIKSSNFKTKLNSPFFLPTLSAWWCITIVGRNYVLITGPGDWKK